MAGGAGFLGTHLCLALLARGDEVVSIDNLVTGSEANLSTLSNEPGFTFLRRDILDAVEVPGPVDVVMNLASPASPKDFAAIPVEILQVGSAGTKRLLDLALAKGPVTSMPRRARSTAIRSCIRSRRRIGAM